MKKLSLADFKAKAVKTDAVKLMETIVGGVMNSCHENSAPFSFKFKIK